MNVKPVTDKNFSVEVVESDLPVLVDFWAEWCGPCQKMKPVLAEIAKEYDGAMKVVSVNADDQLGISNQFSVQGLPTMILFRDGEPVSRTVGARAKQPLLQALGIT